MEINKLKEMSHILSGSESMTSLNDEADSSLFEEANSSQRNGEGRKKGPWTSDEDAMLVEYVRTHGEGNWNLVQKQSGLSRCGKSCRLRWANHLRPDLKKGPFSSQEERLIVELHSKFGNKWARMAAHLPGRTDNEIKNYWNTRVKRCERAGLPLYPPDLNQSMQLQANNHFNNSEPHNRGAQGNNYDITDVIFDHFKGNRGIQPFLPTLHGISSVSSMLNQGSCPFPNYSPLPSTPPQAKRIRSETFLPIFNFGANEVSQFGYFKSATFGKFTHASDPKIRNHVPYGVMPVTPSLLGGDFSSSTSSPGSSNLELPSLQFTPGIGNWKTDSVQPAPLDNIQSPSPSQYPSEPVQSDYSLLRNNGLLDAVLYEPQIQNNTRNQPSETPVDVVDGSLVAIGEDGWEEFIHPLSPLRTSSVTPVYNGRPLVNGEGSSQEQQAQNLLTGSYVELEPLEQVAISDGMKEISSEKNKNNALLDMEWYELVEYCKDQSNIMDGVSISYGEDIQSEYREMVARNRNGTGTGTSTFTQG